MIVPMRTGTLALSRVSRVNITFRKEASWSGKCLCTWPGKWAKLNVLEKQPLALARIIHAGLRSRSHIYQTMTRESSTQPRKINLNSNKTKESSQLCKLHEWLYCKICFA